MNQRMLQHIAVSLTAAVMVTLAAALPATAQSKPELQKVHIGVGGKAALYYLPLTITEQLGAMKVRLSRDGVLVEEGAGKNSLRSPALCLAELAAAIAAQPGAEPLKAGELVSTGSLTDAHPIKAGEQWTVEPDGIDLPPLTLNVHN